MSRPEAVELLSGLLQPARQGVCVMEGSNGILGCKRQLRGRRRLLLPRLAPAPAAPCCGAGLRIRIAVLGGQRAGLRPAEGHACGRQRPVGREGASPGLLRRLLRHPAGKAWRWTA